MRRFLAAAALSCGCALAQATATDVFQKAPPHIDDALRARVTQFFQAHVDGAFRKAEEVVSPESRELFYGLEKKRYLGFEIVKIDYSENFTKATVVTAVEMDWRSPRIGVVRVKPPLTSGWRAEDGQWFWYTTPRKDWDSPWGKMNPGPDNPQGNILAAFKGVTPAEVLSQVKVSKGTVMLSSYEEAHDVVEIANGMPGEIRLRLSGITMPGFSMTVDKSTVKSGETARIQFDYKPETKNPKASSVVDVHIEPTGQVIALQVLFAVPPEVEQHFKRAK